MMNIKKNCPPKYADTLFLAPKDIQEILGIKRSLCYKYLSNAPFRVEKIGGCIRVPAFSFWEWYYEGKQQTEGAVA